MFFQAVLVISILAGIRLLKLLNPYSNNTPRMHILRGMAYGSISGILTAHSLLVAKSAVELIVRTIVDRKNQFNRWQSWMILLGLLFLALTQLYYLHRGLKLCSTSILYPFVFCIYNIIAILDGLIYFHQTSRLSLLSSLLVCSPLSHPQRILPPHSILTANPPQDRPRHHNPPPRRPRPIMAPQHRPLHLPLRRPNPSHPRNGFPCGAPKRPI